MNKSEIAEKAAQNIYGLWADQGRLGVRKFGLLAIQAEVERAIAESQADKIQQFWNAQAEWSQATFGTDAERNHMGPLKHLAKEAVEAQVQPADPVEIADCLFLVFDAARRAGMTLDTLISVAEQKLLVNKARKWNKPTNSEAFAEHVRELGDGEPSSPPKVGTCAIHSPNVLHEEIKFGLAQCQGWTRSGAAQEVSPPSPQVDRSVSGTPEDRAKHQLGTLETWRGDTRELKAAANKLIDYCIDHDWGMMPEPYDSINPLLKLLGRFTERSGG